MTVLNSKLLLNAAAFPWLYEQAGLSVMQSNDLAPRMPGSFYGAKENQDLAVPQLIFAENVLPIAKGLTSCNFTAISPGPGGGLTVADQGIVLRNTQEQRRLFVPADGANYVYNAETNAWASKSPFAFSGSLVTRAYVNGRTFVCYEKTKIVEYDFAGDVLNTIALTFPVGKTIADVRGIGSAGNYLLFFTDIEVYWCSPLNILDFSDLNSGAGNQTPNAIQGQIVAILPISKGAIIYTTKLAVSVQLTNNSQSPFVFDQINSAGGVANWEKVAADASEGFQYAFTTAGLQKISLGGAETIFADVTDFLVGGRFEFWDSVSQMVTSQDAGGPFIVKLTYLVNRYVIISYGMSRYEFQYALVYDTALQRWGKVKITHADVCEYPYPTTFGPVNYDQIYLPWADYGDTTYDEFGVSTSLATPAKRGIAFMQRDGTLNLLNTDFTVSGSTSVLILGHFQDHREYNLTITHLKLNALKGSAVPKVLVLSSDDGHTRDTVTEMDLVKNTGQVYDFDTRVTGLNHDIVILGSFVLSSGLLNGVNHGRR